MTLNPELQRNLWIEVSLGRLIAAPVVLAAALLLGHLLSPIEGLRRAAEILVFLIATVWGTRRAAASMGEEVSAATWDGQRMSALGAWQLAWGKLLGSTAYVWYCAAFCLAAAFWAESRSLPLETAAGNLVERIVAGLLAQSVALAACLVALRKLRPTQRLPVSQCQGLGVLAGIVSVGVYQDVEGLTDVIGFSEAVWYGQVMAAAPFFIAVKAVFLGWALLAVYRLVRLELQLPSTAWAWAAFTLFLAAYVQGFTVYPGLAPTFLSSVSLDSAFAAAIALVYVALLSEPKSPVTYRALGDAARLGNWPGLLRRLPLWLVSLLIALPLGAVLLGQIANGVRLGGPLEEAVPIGHSAGLLWVPAVIVFVLRDVGVFLFFSFSKRQRRADLAGIVYLVVAYGLIPPVLLAAGLDLAVPFVVALPGPSPAAQLGAALGQAMIVWAAVLWRLQMSTGSARPAT